MDGGGTRRSDSRLVAQLPARIAARRFTSNIASPNFVAGVWAIADCAGGSCREEIAGTDRFADCKIHQLDS